MGHTEFTRPLTAEEIREAEAELARIGQDEEFRIVRTANGGIKVKKIEREADEIPNNE